MDEHKPQYWGVMPAEVRYCPGLPATAKVLYTEISALTQMDGICVKDNAYFCELYKISERTLQGHLKALARQGFIAILDGDGGQGRRRIYAGINPLAHNPAKNCGVPVNPAENCGVTPQKTAGTYKDIQDLSQDPPVAPQGAGEGFEPKKAPDWKPERFAKFWAYYPLHKSKQRAIRAWDKLKPSDELLAVIGRALARQIAESKQKAERDRRPWEWKMHASTFLNDARWTDEDESPTGSAGAPFRQGGQDEVEAIPWG